MKWKKESNGTYYISIDNKTFTPTISQTNTQDVLEHRSSLTGSISAHNLIIPPGEYIAILDLDIELDTDIEIWGVEYKIAVLDKVFDVYKARHLKHRINTIITKSEEPTQCPDVAIHFDVETKKRRHANFTFRKSITLTILDMYRDGIRSTLAV